MADNAVVITSAVRTAVGSLNRSLKNVPGHELGSAVISESINRSNLKKDEVDEVIMGQVLTGGTGQNPARQASIHSGIPKENLPLLLIKFVVQELDQLLQVTKVLRPETQV